MVSSKIIIFFVIGKFKRIVFYSLCEEVNITKKKHEKNAKRHPAEDACHAGIVGKIMR